MMITRRALPVLLTLPALAQPPARLIVGFPPGGPLDLAARAIAPVLGPDLVVENMVGESGNLATAAVAGAAPDGRNLLLCGPVHVINSFLFPDLPFDFARDIAPVAGIAAVPLVIEVNPSVPAHSLADLIALARANPGGVRVAYAGRGTPQHVGIALFAMMAGVRFTMLAHPGSAAALEALMGGQADVMFDPLPSSLPHIRAGRLRPLATTGLAPAEALPGLPIAAATLPGYQAGSWFGLGAPRGTPGETIARINAAVNAGLAQAAVLERLRGLGGAILPGSAEAFGGFMAAEAARYGAAIRAADIRAG